MTKPLAWPLDANVVSEMMRPRPEPRVAGFLDSITDEGIGPDSIIVIAAEVPQCYGRCEVVVDRPV